MKGIQTHPITAAARAMFLAGLAAWMQSHLPARAAQETAKPLEAEIQQSSGQTVNPDTTSVEELKLAALYGLMNADPARGLAKIQKLLQSAQAPKIREQALFILSQSESPQALEILADYARGKGDSGLQYKALEYLGLFRGRQSREILAGIYAASNDPRIKLSILRYDMMAEARKPLLAVAQDDKDPQMRREAFNFLSMLGAYEDLAKLYAAESNPGLKGRIIDALSRGGATAKLIDLARTEPDAALRRKAIEALARMGAEKSAEALVGLYDKETDPGLRKKILEALYIQGNAKALVAIVRKETDPVLKKKVVQELSLLRSGEGTGYFLEILDK